MNIFISNLGFSATKSQLNTSIATALHTPDYSHHRNTVHPINFEIFLHPRSPKTAVLTLPTAAIGNQFLQEFGEPNPRKSIVLGTKVYFCTSNQPFKVDVVKRIRTTAYASSGAKKERRRLAHFGVFTSVPLSTIQFGWECRDNTFSVEWDEDVTSGELVFDPERREFRIKIYDSESAMTRIIAIRVAHINWASAAMDSSVIPTLFMSLEHPPHFETEPMYLSGGGSKPPQRQRWSYLDYEHAHVVAYTSLAIRLVCRDKSGLRIFEDLCTSTHIKAGDFLYPVEFRELFSRDARLKYNAWLVSQLPWTVAFQVEAMVCKLLVDLREMLLLKPKISRMVQEKGREFTVLFLRHFAIQAKALFWYTGEARNSILSVEELFVRCQQDFTPPTRPQQRPMADVDTFQCLHVSVTPTRMILDGPYPERSNRIIRQYPSHHDSFLRVSFIDETGLQYRFDRDVDGRSFIKRRVGSLLTVGLKVAGRRFHFLAYSQSALKEHAVWFVKEFVDANGRLVNAATIIEGLGTFSGLLNDPKLIYCPARYGARISQAFTATDSSVTVEPEEIFELDDIKRGKWCFTDGVGTISAELACAIWKTLAERNRGVKGARTYPRAFQIRFMGSKGMLSVDYRLAGRAICIRPSMIKFEAPSSLAVEIARAFYRPGPFYLNRQLIMILEALGIPYEVFAKLQRAAVRDAQESVKSLERSARLLEAYGLGASYRMTSVMLSLHKLGVGPLREDPFWRRMMDFSVNHVLRELKYHARIPVPQAWNLVGVADIHGYLKKGEIFGCIVPPDGTAPIYLTGPTMISRSPTIHPGDVQIARGIGKPPPGSPFEKESLRNTLVFSVKGARPLPSYLGGGDLDGDEYRVTMLKSLRPRRTYPPAKYDAAQKMLLNRPSTMQDVADFVTEYISSDTLGIIATTWLIVADRSALGILDKKCLILSALHSDAVDYPKTGRPVPIDRIPRPDSRLRPDWSAPETARVSDPRRYYVSQRAIGRLYREIDLPAVETIGREEHFQHWDVEESDQASLRKVLEAFRTRESYKCSGAFAAVKERVLDHISIDRHDAALVTEIWDLYKNYASELQTICSDHTLSRGKDAMLTEEEVVIGTIVAQCSQPRKRKDLMSNLREHATALVDAIRGDLAGGIETLPRKSMERAWVALRISMIEEDLFGARSFAWIAMGEIFEVIRNIEASEGLF